MWYLKSLDSQTEVKTEEINISGSAGEETEIEEECETEEEEEEELEEKIEKKVGQEGSGNAGHDRCSRDPGDSGDCEDNTPADIPAHFSGEIVSSDTNTGERQQNVIKTKNSQISAANDGNSSKSPLLEEGKDKTPAKKSETEREGSRTVTPEIPETNIFSCEKTAQNPQLTKSRPVA